MHVFLWESPTLFCTSEAQLEVQNGEVDVRWYLSSFAPPYVKVLPSLLSSDNTFIFVYCFFFLLSSWSYFSSGIKLVFCVFHCGT